MLEEDVSEFFGQDPARSSVARTYMERAFVSVIRGTNTPWSSFDFDDAYFIGLLLSIFHP